MGPVRAGSERIPGCAAPALIDTILRMLGIDRRTARITWTVILMVLLLEILYRIREILFIFILALLLAYLLWPLVKLLDRRLPGRSRTPALAIVYLVLIGLLVVIGIEIGSRVVVEANALASRVPELLAKVQQATVSTGPPPPGSVKATVISTARKQVAEHSRDLVALLTAAGLKLVSAAGKAIFIILVPILSFFFLKDGSEMRQSLLETFADGEQRERVKEIMADLHLLLAQYMRALVVLAASAFVAYFVFLNVIGAPYAVLLSTVAFPLEFIPMIGPVTAAVIVLLVTGLSGFHHLLWIVIFVILFRLFQDYVVSPQVMSAGMEIHPLAIIFGVLAGAALGGIAGTFLSVPVLATLRIIYRRVVRKPSVVAVTE